MCIFLYHKFVLVRYNPALLRCSIINGDYKLVIKKGILYFFLKCHSLFIAVFSSFDFFKGSVINYYCVLSNSKVNSL